MLFSLINYLYWPCFLVLPGETDSLVVTVTQYEAGPSEGARCCSVTSLLALLLVDLCGAINPRQKLSHVGVNPGVVGLGTALAPAHYTYQAPREFVLANQGAPAVPLQDSKDWSTTGM